LSSESNKYVDVKCSERNLSLNQIKLNFEKELSDVNHIYESSFVIMLWNINTINDRKINKIIDIKSILNETTTQWAINKSGIVNNCNKESCVDLIAIMKMGKKSSKFNMHDIPGYKLKNHSCRVE
jgi:hypothetical protein